MYAIYQEMKVFHHRVHTIVTPNRILAENNDAEAANRLLLELEQQFRSPLRVYKLKVFCGEYNGLSGLLNVLEAFSDNEEIILRALAVVEDMLEEAPASLTKYDYSKNWLNWEMDHFVTGVGNIIENPDSQIPTMEVAERLYNIFQLVERLITTDLTKEVARLVSLMRVVRHQSYQCDDPVALKTNVTEMCSLFSWATSIHLHNFVKWEMYFLLMHLIECSQPITPATLSDQFEPNYLSVHPLVFNVLLDNFNRFSHAKIEFVDVILAEITNYTSLCRKQDAGDVQVFCCDSNPPTTWDFYLSQYEVKWPEFPPFPRISDNVINVESYMEMLYRFLQDPLRCQDRDRQIFLAAVDYLTQTPEPFLCSSWYIFKTLLYEPDSQGSHEMLDSNSCINIKNVFMLDVPLEIKMHFSNKENCCPLHVNLNQVGSVIMDSINQQVLDNVHQISNFIMSEEDGIPSGFRSHFFLNLPLICSCKEILRDLLLDTDGLDCIFKELHHIEQRTRRNAKLSVLTLADILQIDPLHLSLFLNGNGDSKSVLDHAENEPAMILLKQVFVTELNSATQKETSANV